MDYNLVEIWVVFLKLLKSLLLVDLKHLLLDPDSSPLVFFALFLEICGYHVLETRFGFEGPNLSDPADNHIFQHVFKSLGFGDLGFVGLFGDQVLG